MCYAYRLEYFRTVEKKASDDNGQYRFPSGPIAEIADLINPPELVYTAGAVLIQP